MDLLDRMLERDRWASVQLLDLCRSLADADLDTEFDVGHGTLRATFDHMIFNIELRSAVMSRRPFDPFQQRDVTLPGLVSRHDHALAEFAVIGRRHRDERRLFDTYIDQFGEHPTFGGTFIHLLLHNEEHRAEALHILKRLGVKDLPEIDYLLWELTTQDSA